MYISTFLKLGIRWRLMATPRLDRFTLGKETAVLIVQVAG